MLRPAFPVLAIALALAAGGCKRKAAPDTLVLAEESAATDFDPRAALDAYSSRVINLLYAGLVSQNAQAEIVPDLASAWTYPDARTYVFTLRDGLTFHDGRRLTADDVVYTFTSILDPAFGSPKADQFRDVESVKALDARTVEFRLKQPFSPFLQSLTTGIVPKGAGPELSRRPVGAGPFKLIDFDPGARVTLGAFEHYHGGRPRIRRLVIKAVPNDTTRILELRKGSVQLLVNSVPPDALAKLRAESDLQLIEQPGLNVSYLGFNFEDSALRNVKVRRAIARAVDRDSIIRHLLGGGAVTTATVLAPLLWAHAPTLPAEPYDPASARRLLDEAGYRDPDGAGPRGRFKLTYKTSTNPLRRRIAEAIGEQLRAVGIDVEVRSFEFATFFDDIKKGNFQLYSLVWVGIVEPDALYNMFHSASMPPAGANRGRYANPRIDDLLERGRRTLAPPARRAIYIEAQRVLAEELPYVTLWVQNDVAVASRRLQGFTLYPGGDYTGLIHAWMEQQSP